MFVSLFCGVLEVSTGRFVYSNAGHNAPVALVPGEAATFLPVPKGIVVGAFGGAVYLREERRLEPGESVLLYTDGVTEATGPDLTLYGEDRLLAALTLDAIPEPQALVAHVQGEVARFTGGHPPSDDLTLLALRWRAA
jgi:sigma-B regulation protein RsbU (phosphoserine phosphatase)